MKQTDIVLEMDQGARMEFKLTVSAISQSVEIIEAGASLVNTENGTRAM